MCWRRASPIHGCLQEWIETDGATGEKDGSGLIGRLKFEVQCMHIRFLANAGSRGVAFKKLKSMNGKPMKYVVCEARPLCGLAVARRISSKHKQELTGVTGGSRRFLQIGECHFEDGAYIFISEQSVPGLARRLQKAVRNFTGKKFKIVHGGETIEEDDEQPDAEHEEEAQAPAAAAAAPEPAALGKAPEVWRKTLETIEANIGQLKDTVLKEFGDEEPEILDEVKELITRFDGVLEKMDHSLVDSLVKAHAAQDAAARAAELKKSKDILKDFIEHVKSDELIAHIDKNPWFDTNLKHHLGEGLKHMAEAIGRIAG